MALLLLLFCLAYGSQVRTSGIIPEDVQAGYFRGRSGNIVFKELQDQTVDSAVFLLDPASHLKVLDDSASLSGYEFADIVTSSLGLEKLNNAVAPSIVGKDMFNPVRANVLFVVESLGTEMATRMSLPNLGNNGDGAFASGAKKTVEMKIHPANSLALLTSLVSGTPPSSHGIIGRSWKSKAEGRVVDAFSSASSGSQVANLADLLSQSLPQSFSLSVSSDKQLASANAINLALDNSSSVLLSLNQRTQGFEASSSSFASLSQSREQILSNLKGEKSCLFALQAGSSPVHARINNDLVVIDFPSAWGQGRDSATFDLHVPADYTFFAELQFVHTLPERLSLASGKAPHLHTVVLASTTQLIEKYGRESPEVRAAFHLLDAWLPQVNQKWLSAYQNEAVSEVVLLGSHQSVAQGADSRDVLRRLVQIMPNQEGIQEFFPSLYLDDKQALRFCQHESDLLPITVQPYGFGVYCPWFSLAPRTDALNSLTSSSLFALTADNNTNNTNTSGPTANAVERYQVALWISIIMAFAVYWAVYSTVFMSFKKDTMLYSSFNPNWEDRKRR